MESHCICKPFRLWNNFFHHEVCFVIQYYSTNTCSDKEAHSIVKHSCPTEPKTAASNLQKNSSLDDALVGNSRRLKHALASGSILSELARNWTDMLFDNPRGVGDVALSQI